MEQQGASRWLAVVVGAVALALLLAAAAWQLVGERATTSYLLHAPTGGELLARHDAAEGRLGERTGGDPTAALAGDAAALWDQWVALVPPYYARRVEVFELTTDGVGNGTVAAFVSPLDPEGKRWRLAVDPADARQNPDYYARTLVHELAHIITLSGIADGDPLDSLAAARAACPDGGFTGGCFTGDSLMATWMARFWTDEDVAAADAARGRLGEPDAGGLVARHSSQRSRFVSVYATSDPEEDVAESVVALAFGDDQPAGSEAAAKLDTLREDPEVASLVIAVRDRLRG